MSNASQRPSGCDFREGQVLAPEKIQLNCSLAVLEWRVK
jgi:hypothetical protein